MAIDNVRVRELPVGAQIGFGLSASQVAHHASQSWPVVSFPAAPRPSSHPGLLPAPRGFALPARLGPVLWRLLTPPCPSNAIADAVVQILRTDPEASQGKPCLFPAVPPDLPPPRPGSFRALPYWAGSPHGRWPCIRFLFVGAAFRLRLPSDSASRRTPLSSAIRFGATSVR